VQTRYDAAGNLTFDGEYVYQYDAWGRLIQVNLGTPSAGEPGYTVGLLVKGYSYDAWGRLSRIVSPFPAPGSAQVRVERLHYDGVRRIQEVLTDPVLNLGDAADQGNSEAQGQVGEGVDGQTLPGSVNEPVPGTTLSWLEREYVWGPGDSFAGVDELLVQFDKTGEPWFTLHDGGGDVAALAQLGSYGSAGARVAAQWTYDAYGSVHSADHLHAHPFNRVGHKGLFFDRLDTGVADSATWMERPRLVPYAHLIGHVRNRAYNPLLGRWIQADPNATGQMLLFELGVHGRPITPSNPSMDLEQRFVDGASVHAYLRGQPWLGSDPTGLFRGQYAVEAGIRIGELAYDLIGTYSANMEADAEWASDWEYADDMHTRGDARWVYELFAVHIEQALEDAIWPLSIPFDMSAGFPGKYIRSSYRLTRLAINGVRVLRGVEHHAFMRFLTRWKSNVREVVVLMPQGVHKEMHVFVDRFTRGKIRCPSMWDKGGVEVWRRWFAQTPNGMEAIIKTHRDALQAFVAKKKKEGIVIDGLVEAFDAAVK